MALYVTSYRQRVEVVEDAGHILWAENPLREINDRDRWEGRVSEIHEGGEAFGAQWAVFHLARTNVDPEEDVPVFGGPTDKDIASKSWKVSNTGRKLYRIEGELWRTEWVDPAAESPIVRGDEIPPTVYFITDAEGKKETRETLAAGRRWIWFRPDVVGALLAVRGGSLGWYTRDTGSVGCSPGCGVHFGVNSLGLINVYAKDIALLPDWQQRIWAGHNVSPDGKVSEELLAAQMMAAPAGTLAPEALLADTLKRLNEAGETKLGITIIRYHTDMPDLIMHLHRFRATSREGLFALAKDLARATAESFDAKQLQKLAPPPKDVKWGSLKSLENLLTTKIHPSLAKGIMGPLFGINELRQADAHLTSSDVRDSLKLSGVDETKPYVMQGFQLLDSCVSTLSAICKAIESF